MASPVKWFAFALVGLLLVFAAAQLVQPDRTNPPLDPGRTLAAGEGANSPLVAIVDRSCGDCHSSATRWTGYARVAPLSWAMSATVSEGRRAVNFSEWAGYAPAQQQQLLTRSCKAARSGKMPGGVWTLFHPEARLSADDIRIICTAASEERL